MPELKDPADFKALHQEAARIWEGNAAWDDYMGEGNDHHLELISPAQERLLEIEKDEQVLEIACGNGSFARRMACLGAIVTATDQSATFIERARKGTTENADRIEFFRIDATDADALMGLGEARFDAAVCGMAMMDMSAIAPMVHSLARLLRPGGRFVFSVMHPCFNAPTAIFLNETEDRDGELITTHSVKMSRYITPDVRKGLGVASQPEPHYYFSRPISMLFNLCFGAGFVLDGIEEPVFDAVPDRKGMWASRTEIPPVLVARMRLPV